MQRSSKTVQIRFIPATAERHVTNVLPLGHAHFVMLYKYNKNTVGQSCGKFVLLYY